MMITMIIKKLPNREERIRVKQEGQQHLLLGIEDQLESSVHIAQEPQQLNIRDMPHTADQTTMQQPALRWCSLHACTTQGQVLGSMTLPYRLS